METRAVLVTGEVLDCLAMLPDRSVHCCVTSPPYWGLRDYGEDGQIGLEPTPEEYVAKLVEVFREVRRVLRDDGTLWLNLGDSYANDGKWGGSSGGKHVAALHGSTGVGRGKTRTGLKPKDLVGIPWRVAFALQADGWWLRSGVVWAKPNPMPESVNGWRWEQHRVRGEGGALEFCGGCPKCLPNDGLVLRRGSWRCTTGHEFIFQLTKSDCYFSNAEAVREPLATNPKENYPARARATGRGSQGAAAARGGDRDKSGGFPPSGKGKNPRSVWTVATRPFPKAHFAVFPETLPKRCILASTARRVCGRCGSPWVPIVMREKAVSTRGGERGRGGRQDGFTVPKGGAKEEAARVQPESVGERPSCGCGASGARPSTVLDIFSGAGTTGLVCAKLGRHYIGFDISSKYTAMAAERILSEVGLAAEKISPGLEPG